MAPADLSTGSNEDWLPLAGLRVIDVGTRISAPFCAGLLGELGAEVIKVELPAGGDFMRTIGPFVPDPDDPNGPGYSLFWSVEGRGRKGATCDLRTTEGQELFRRLAGVSDVVCENFRPGTMESWHLGPDDLDKSLVYVRVSVFGQDGPYSQRPGLDRMGIAYGGLLHLTGYPDRPPVRPGVTISDYLTGVFAATGALAALYARDASGSGADSDQGGERAHATERGAVIDAPLYASVLRVLEWTVAGYDRLGIVRAREGNRLATSAPIDNYPSADGRYVCIVAGSDANFARLCSAMGRPELTGDPRFRTLSDRASRADEINSTVASWTMSLDASEIEQACIAAGVPVARAYSAADIASDPHFEARGDLVEVDDPVAGPVLQQAPFPRLRGKRPAAPRGAPRLGEHNRYVWCDLAGLSEDELAELIDAGVV